MHAVELRAHYVEPLNGRQITLSQGSSAQRQYERSTESQLIKEARMHNLNPPKHIAGANPN
jgi:hypothetical protein